MKTKKPLTIGQLKKWCADNNISDDTPIGIYLGDCETGSISYGIIGDTEDEIDEETLEPNNHSETTGLHCYMSNADIFYNTGIKQAVMITDGCHDE